MSTRDISPWVNTAGETGSPYRLRVLIVYKFWEPQPPGTVRASPGLYTDCFTLLPQTRLCPNLINFHSYWSTWYVDGNRSDEATRDLYFLSHVLFMFESHFM